ncbi:MAG: hypothetical protein H6705_16855 [Myxococcales bacterium]|nr:hypothetical protein [Myxococcales bacterium]
MSRSPWFSTHAIARARERFPELRGLGDVQVVARLQEALLDAKVVLEEPAGYVVPQGRKLRWHGDRELGKAIARGRLGATPVEFVVDPRTGSVLTVTDPDERPAVAPRRRRRRSRR